MATLVAEATTSPCAGGSTRFGRCALHIEWGGTETLTTSDIHAILTARHVCDHQGGTRGTSFIHSKLLGPNPVPEYSGLMHAVDWFHPCPTNTFLYCERNESKEMIAYIGPSAVIHRDSAIP